MKKLLLFLAFLGILAASWAQTPIGQFRAHIPLHSFHSVAVADDYIYAATNNGLLLVDKETIFKEHPDISSWSKVEGLSDIDITKIFFDKRHNTLIVAYDNGNLDIIRDSQLYNLKDIKDKPITGSKKLSHIRVYDNNTYLVYPFGVVIINLNDLVIEDTWFTKREGVQYIAKDMAVSDQRYFISTESGIFSIAKSSANPANFMEWQLEATAGEHDYDHLVAFNGNIIANKNATEESLDTLFILHQDEWIPTTLSYQDVRSINVNNNELIICNWDYVELFDTTLTRTYLAGLYPTENSLPSAQEAQTDGQLIWVAESYYGLMMCNRGFYTLQVFKDSGPYDLSTKSICSLNGITIAVPGSPSGSSFAPSYHFPSVSWFDKQQWQYNADDFVNWDPNHPTADLTNVVINPNDESEWYIASWGNGLFKCKDHRVTAHYNAANSPLDSTLYGKTFVSGLAFDKKGNLWLTNSESEKMLKMMEPDGTWHAFNIGSGVLVSTSEGVVADHLLIDSRDFKWVNYPRGSDFTRYNLVVFSDGGTYDNPGDDKFARIDMNTAAKVVSTTVYCMAEDLDGEIWIGTDKGIKVIYYPSKVFEGGSNPLNILLEQDGYVSVLFEYEEITAIAVDGANRKWIGTSKAGVFLMSDDGQEQLLHFTAEDNPLFANQITSICIDQLSGEVFFGTAKGLVSYRGTATAGFETYEDLPVYPNPVRHGYSGYVAINGLKANSLCKITDAAGQLVWQGYSNGGELIWNCLDHFGKRPATGVYYVMASDENGKEKIVTKFLFIH